MKYDSIIWIIVAAMWFLTAVMAYLIFTRPGPYDLFYGLWCVVASISITTMAAWNQWNLSRQAIFGTAMTMAEIAFLIFMGLAVWKGYQLEWHNYIVIALVAGFAGFNTMAFFRWLRADR